MGLIMTLSSRRHKFVRFVFDQDTGMWLDCHERAFAFFGGVPEKDHPRQSQVRGPEADIDDPYNKQGHADMERFFGFVADPAKIGTAQHKGKVERTVPTVRKHLLAGRTFADINEGERACPKVVQKEIGMEIHGTTKKKPYPTFLIQEKPTSPVPARGPLRAPLEGVHRPSRPPHRSFDESHCSLPTRYIGRRCG